MDLSRRTFVGALGAPAVLGAQSPNDAIRLAFIGVGNRGAYLLQNSMEASGVSVVAVCDLLEDRLEAARIAASEKGHSPRAFTDFRKMLDEMKDIDAVLIATPVNTHKAIALAALEVGKHVYLEKPLAVTPEDSKLIVRASQSAKGIFQVGFQLRHDPNRAAAMKFIHDGNIGKVLFLQGYRHGGDLPRNTAWYFDRDIAGDNIVEQACHIIDLMVWAVDKPPLRAYGSGGINLFHDIPPGRTTMDNYAVIYEFPDDVRFVFSHIYFDPPGFSGIKERVFGAVGAVDLAAATFHERANRGAVQLEVPNAGENSTLMSLKAFFDNARGQKTPINNGDSGLRSVLTAMMGRRAIYEKRIVTWDEVAG